MQDIKAITAGPGFHWFGYYDKLQFSPDERFVLGMEVDFEHRSPRVEDEIRLGLIDLRSDYAWREIGRTTAWCWQQGCMLQWRPGSGSEVLWNERDGQGGLRCRIFDTATGESRTVPYPVYAVSPDGAWAVTADFFRTGWLRPGYGYAGEDPSRDNPAPTDSGIRRVDLDTGESTLLFSVADVADIPHPNYDTADCFHYFNHLLVNTDGSRFIFLHRWKAPGQECPIKTRAMTASADGSDIRVLNDSGHFSHFIWPDPQHVLAYAAAEPGGEWLFLLHDDTGGRPPQPVGAGVMGPGDGHCTYLPDRDWILNDTYPRDDDRKRGLYLYHVPTHRRVDLGWYDSPIDYEGEWRVDLHPRQSPDGRRITIDSVHEGKGRQMYLMDISEIVG
jgi:hypothetical protein